LVLASASAGKVVLLVVVLIVVAGLGRGASTTSDVKDSNGLWADVAVGGTQAHNEYIEAA
jgi:hypothetical protein